LAKAFDPRPFVASDGPGGVRGGRRRASKSQLGAARRHLKQLTAPSIDGAYQHLIVKMIVGLSLTHTLIYSAFTRLEIDSPADQSDLMTEQQTHLSLISFSLR
jgi:hypothetical protein